MSHLSKMVPPIVDGAFLALAALLCLAYLPRMNL